MTTSSTNNSVFRGFFKKQKLMGPNFIDRYRQLRIVLSIEDKLNYLEQLIPPAPVAPAGQHVAPEILVAHNAWIKGSKEIAGLMLITMEPEIQRTLEPLHAHEMLRELKTLFAQQAGHELLRTTRDFHSCKQKEGQSVSSYVLKMKGYIDNLERFGYLVTLVLGGCEALVKRDTLTKPDKLKPRSIKCFFIGYPKETMGYSFYYPPENKVLVARNAEFLENSLINQEASRSLEDLEIIQEEDTHPSIDTSLNHEEDDLEIDEPQIGSKWLFKKKTDMDGVVHTYKARLVAKGYTQTSGIDYEETFSPVANIRAIRILIAIVAYYDYEIWQIDVKTAFLNGYLNEEVYMEKPKGFINLKYPNWVCKLKRSIYGLKQASRQWNKRFDDRINKFGFTQNRDELCVYLKASGSNITFLILYADEILIMGNNIPMLESVKSYLGRCFAMKDLGEAAYILGIQIYRDRSRRLIGLCQSAYIEKILKRYCMENFKRGSMPMQEKLKLSKSQGASTPGELKRMQNVPYASAVGTIMYAVRCTHPDVAFAQNVTSQFQQNLGDLHWTTIKNILKYLRNTKDMFLVYEGDLKQELRVSCYTDAGYLTDADDLKSLDMSEYIAAFDASKEAVWVRKFIYGLGVVPTIEEPISMYCDNTGAIAIANESGITKGARHFRAKVHYLREVIEYGDIKLRKVHR
nr:retrotransposon protein, putative, Ty1-copia subclass [Tanacetum cinerariifolium]